MRVCVCGCVGGWGVGGFLFCRDTVGKMEEGGRGYPFSIVTGLLMPHDTTHPDQIFQAATLVAFWLLD